MFFDGLIQRKLASLLRPWLSQEPEWEVNLGFFRSLIVARRLCFDVATLNSLIGDSEEVRLLFKSVTVEELSFRAAHLSAPAFTFEIRGVDVKLSPERRAQRRVSKRVEDSLDDYLEKKKKNIVSQLDPEGAALHDRMMMTMMTSTLKDHIKNSITNLVLTHCCLHLHDAHVRVEFPIADDKVSWLCSMRELNAKSSQKEMGCFLGGLIGLVFLPFREISFNLEASLMEIVDEKKDHCSPIIYCLNPHIDIKLKDLRLINFRICVPELNLSFSPGTLQMVIAFSNLFYIEYKHIRSGRLLWEIVRSKIHNVLLPSEYSLYKMVLVTVFWLRLVKEYQHLLASIGYSKDGMKMRTAHNIPRQAEQHWKVISEIEKELPAEALVSAWQVARYRTAFKKTSESSVNSHFNCFWRLFYPLVLVWATMLRIFAIIMTVFLPYNTVLKNTLGQLRMISEFSESRQCFFLSVGKISATISSLDASCPSVHKNQNVSNLSNRNSYRDLFSFGLIVRESLYIFEEGICQQYVSFSVGFLEIISASPFGVSETSNNSRSSGGDAPEGSFKERLTDSKTIIWGEPALICSVSEDGETGSAAIPFLKQLPAEIELLQKKMHSRFQEIKAQYHANPWALCDMQTSGLYPGIQSPDSGFLKCNLLLGKLNFTLGYSSFVAITTLTEQVVHAVSQFEGSDNTIFQEFTARAFQDSPKVNWSHSLTSFVKEKTMRLSELLPNKNVELRALVAGPCIQISLRDEELSSSSTHGSEGIILAINVHDSDFAIWPMARSADATCGKPQRVGDPKSEFFKLEESLINECQLELDHVNYASKGQISLSSFLTFGGLNAYFEDYMENHVLPFLSLKLLTAKFTSSRYYLHSFGRSVVTSSLSLSGAMTGGVGFFYMDELCFVLQAFERFISAASITGPECSDSGTSHNHQVRVELDHEMRLTEHAVEEAVIGFDEREALSLGSVSFIVSASFELAPFDIILHSSRNVMEKRDISMGFHSNTTRKLGLAELPDNGIWLSSEKTCLCVSVQETKAAIDADFRGFHAILFRHKNQIGSADKHKVEDTILPSVDYLDEVFLSSCAITLLLDCLDNSEELRGTDSATSINNTKGLLSDSLPSTICIEGLGSESIQDNDFDSGASAPVSSPWLLINVTIGMLFMGMCSVKDGLLGVHPLDEMHLSLSVGGDFQNISLGIQGGSIFIEASVLARFALCLNSYLQLVRSSLYTKYAETAKPGSYASKLGRDHFEEPTQRKTRLADPVKWKLLEALSTNLSQFSIVILTIDESGMVKEIIGRVDFFMKLWVENRKKKFLANLSHLAVLSQIMDAVTGETEIDIQVPHFSSVASSNESLWLNHEDSAAESLHRDNSSVLSENASCSRPSTSLEISPASHSASPASQANKICENYILERLTIFVSAEEPLLRVENCEDCIIQGWVGNGSISGLDMTISLSEIQVGLESISSLQLFYKLDTINEHCTIFYSIPGAFIAYIIYSPHLVEPFKLWGRRIIGEIIYIRIGDPENSHKLE